MASSGGAPSTSSEDYDASSRAVLSVLLVLTTLCTVARAASRYITRTPLGLDDVLAYVAFLLNTGELICGFIGVQLGYVNSQALMTISPGKLKTLSNNMTVLGALYLAVLIPIKLSILCLHRRIFTLNVKWIRYYWWANFLLVFPCWTTIAFTLFGLVFNPLREPGLNSIVTPLVGSVNAGSDLLILVLPIACIRGLKMARHKKYLFYGVFSLALLACAMSILRFSLIVARHGRTVNPIKDRYSGLCTTVAETSVGLMCVCLPVCYPLVQKTREYASRSYSDFSSFVVRQTTFPNSKASRSDSAKPLEGGITHFTELRQSPLQQTPEDSVDGRSR